MKKYILIYGVLITTFGCSSTDQETNVLDSENLLKTAPKNDVSSLVIYQDTLLEYGETMPNVLIINKSSSTFDSHDLVSDQ